MLTYRRFDSVSDQLETMLFIADASPVYNQGVLTPTFIDRAFAPAVRLGKVAFLSLSDTREPVAFFTYCRPTVIPMPTDPAIDWLGHGPYLWVVDMCCEPGHVGAQELWDSIENGILQAGLATPGDRVLYWRSQGRLGWATVRERAA